MTSWKRDFASGLVVLGPILVTLYILYWLYSFLAGLTPGQILAAGDLTWLVAGESETAVQIRQNLAEFIRIVVVLVVFIILTFSVGYLMRTTVGGLVERLLDDFANRVPGLRVVYNASKMAAETAFGEQDSLQKPVKIETWNGLRMTAFKTGKISEDGRDVLFLPTSPNITTGFVVEVESDRVTELDEDVEEALTRVLSAGFGDADRNDRGMDAGVPIDVIDDRISEAKEFVDEHTADPRDVIDEQTGDVTDAVGDSSSEGDDD